MATITEVRDRFVKAAQSMGSLFVKSYKETEPEAVDANIDQMLAGKKADGSQIGDYAPMTIAIRSSMNKQTDFVDLNFTGAFQGAMKFTEITEEYAELTSTDWKTDKLTKVYGDDIFGLDKSNMEEYKTQWLHVFVQKLKGIIYGTN